MSAVLAICADDEDGTCPLLSGGRAIRPRQSVETMIHRLDQPTTPHRPPRG